jgi:general secretion pathway protein M
LASGGGSLLGRVDVAVREAGLSGTVRRVQPEGDDRVQVWLEGIGFDAMLGWLTVLQRDHGVRVDSLAVDRRAEPGMVDGRVLLLLEAK